MPRMNITITDAINELLKAESERTHVPIAELIRQYIEAGLITAGHKPPPDKVKWGGKRKPPSR